MHSFGDKGSIRGQRSNFRISIMPIWIAVSTVSRLKLDEKSIDGGFIGQKGFQKLKHNQTVPRDLWFCE